MSQRSRARLAADPAMALWPLPHAVVLRIFAFVPVHTRLRGREVCRAWRAALEERSLWTHIDLSMANVLWAGIQDYSRTYGALLRAALAHSAGELVVLDAADNALIPEADLLYTAAANAGALLELRFGGSLDQLQIATILQAAPRLLVFETGAHCHDFALARQWLSNEAPLFAPLRLQTLHLWGTSRESEADVLVLAAGLAAHTSLRELSLHSVDFSSAAALGAVVDAAIVRQLEKLSLFFCTLSPASVPAQATLIEYGSLKTLTLSDPRPSDLYDLSRAEALGAALNRNNSLIELWLTIPDLWRIPAAGDALLAGLVGHRTLRTLSLTGFTSGASQVAAGTALGALVAANSPALRMLLLDDTALRDEGLRPICEALQSNTHLTYLNLDSCSASIAFLRGVLLPAVQARPSLHLA